ncbi:MAG: ABC transporter substrate-binding protein [Proteobacteria bacterium]|nr:ABC transporter substrate-binding protein [Pseudomonadota bacterium]
MKRRQFLQLAAAPALLSSTRALRAQGKQKITYAYLLDPVYESVTWAIKNGRVKSDLIDVEAIGANIPTLLQATSTKQFDVIMTAVIGVPAAAARGLELRILSAALYASPAGEGGGVWVKKGSPIKTAADLKGKTLASYGLRATGYMFVREAMVKKYGLNMALEGGDVRQVEVQAPNLPAALATGQADAAALIHSQAWRALQTGDFVNILESTAVNNEIHGRLVSAVNVSYPEKLAARPEAFKEFNRMLKESIAYTLSHRDEVFGALAKQANIDRKFFDWWFDRTSSVPAVFGAEHAKAVTTAWNIGLRLGMIKSVPNVSAYTWEHALKS